MKILRQRIKHQRPIRVSHGPIPQLIDDADDLHHVSLQREPFTDGIAVGPQLLGKRSIDNDHARRGLIVVRGKIAARHDTRAQGL